MGKSNRGGSSTASTINTTSSNSGTIGRKDAKAAEMKKRTASGPTEVVTVNVKSAEGLRVQRAARALSSSAVRKEQRPSLSEAANPGPRVSVAQAMVTDTDDRSAFFDGESLPRHASFSSFTEQAVIASVAATARPAVIVARVGVATQTDAVPVSHDALLESKLNDAMEALLIASSENSSLREVLAEYHGAVDLIMSKHREQMSSLDASHMLRARQLEVELAEQTAARAQAEKMSAALCDRIDEMVHVMAYAAELEERSSAEMTSEVRSLRVENDAMRQLLSIAGIELLPEDVPDVRPRLPERPSNGSLNGTHTFPGQRLFDRADALSDETAA
eukprot:Opistho-2@8893